MNPISRGNHGERLVQFLFVLPALFIFTIFFVYPAATSVWYSFTDWNGIGRNYNFVGFSNYKEMFNNPIIFGTIPTTFYYALLNSLMMSVGGFLVALALNRESRFTSTLRVSFFIPMLIAGVVVGFVFREMYAPALNADNMGIINGIFYSVGLEGLAANWLGNPDTAMLVVTLTGVWNQVGMTALIYLAAMQIIPRDLYEAAKIDGAGYWKQVYHITWSMVAPALTLNMILLLVNSLKEFDMISQLTMGGPGTATKVINISIIDYSISSFKVGLGSAMAVVVTVCVFIIVILIHAILKRRELGQ
jgi:raffinose/stachyose/melibiose transport system permease protein